MRCEMQLGILAAVLLAAATLVLAETDFLAEKPPYFSPCKQTDPNFNKCLASNIQVVFNEWKDGIPGLKSVGPIDPFYIKRIAVTQNSNNPLAQLNADLSKVKASGLSKVKVKEASFDVDKLIMKLVYAAPKLDIESQYNLKGRILNLALNGNGPSSMTLDDVEITVAMRLKRRVEHDLLFLDIDKIHLEITKIGGFHLQLDNLFNGQKDLEDSTNAVINQNWREFHKVFGPAIDEALQTVIADRFKKIYAYIPVSYYIEDIPVTN